jgi:hypothetical protein
LSGSSNGGVQYAENVAGKGKPPELKAFQPLIPAGARAEAGGLLSEADVKAPSQATRIWVDDVNADGKLDILVGDSVTLVSPAKGVTEEQFKAKYAEWQKDSQAALATLGSTKDEAEQTKAREAFSKLYQRRSEFMTQEMTGFVWLYLQK